MKAITDNAHGVDYRDLGYSEQDLSNLMKIANVDIGSLNRQSHQNLLVFPPRMDYYGDGIGGQHILSIHGDYLNTGNILGFVGINGTRLRIKSRFGKEDGEDYFLHYLLQKVLSINLFDLRFGTSDEPVFDFLLYLFPYYLKRALGQGLFKQYRRFEYNDAKVRGIIDVGRHVKENVPFKGTVAYSTREYSYDNSMTELIRHTIEFVSTKPQGRSLLQRDVRTVECIGQIRQATPSYAASRRQNILDANLRPVHHPFFSEYTHLQRICVRILKNAGIKFGDSDDTIYGVLFDGAWLWEEYLNTLLGKEGFIHPRNKEAKGGFRMFLKPDDRNSSYDNDRKLFPDFYKDNFILDAKYKRLDKGLRREDLYQVVTYMYCRRAHMGAYVYPLEHEGKINRFQLSGYGDGTDSTGPGYIYVIPFAVPQNVSDWKDFCKQMSCSEEVLRSNCHLQV